MSATLRLRSQGIGVTGVAAKLLAYRVPEGCARRLFFCQREAIETIVFLVEARATHIAVITILGFLLRESLRIARAVDALVIQEDEKTRRLFAR